MGGTEGDEQLPDDFLGGQFRRVVEHPADEVRARSAVLAAMCSSM